MRLPSPRHNYCNLHPHNTGNLSADSWFKQHQRLPLQAPHQVRQCQTQGLLETPLETQPMHALLCICGSWYVAQPKHTQTPHWETMHGQTNVQSKSRQGLYFLVGKNVETLESPWNSMKALENHMQTREKPWKTFISSKQSPWRMFLFPEKAVCGMCSEGAQAFGNRPTYAKPHWVANWPIMVRMRKIGLLSEQQPTTY